MRVQKNILKNQDRVAMVGNSTLVTLAQSSLFCRGATTELHRGGGGGCIYRNRPPGGDPKALLSERSHVTALYSQIWADSCHVLATTLVY